MNKRIWLITGVSSGLGKSMARTAIKNGDFVIGTFRSQKQVDSFNNAYSNQGKGIKLDINNFRDIDKAIDDIKNEFGKIDVLVNNAGFGFIGAVEEASISEIRAVMETNFFGTLKLTQSVLPLMRKKKKGHIIQISSHGGVKAFPGFGIYNASKFALEGFSEALAGEIEPLGIKMTIVEPGPFRTGFAGDKLIEAEKIIEDYNQTAGSFRSKLKQANGMQEGDPQKAAKVILDIVNGEIDTLRVPLGKVPLTTIKMKIDSLHSDLESNRKIAASTVFEN